MKLLQEKIKAEGEVLSETILKVDSFLNHQIDAKLMLEIGKEFANLFKDEKITKVITIEVSGIAPAMAAAAYLDVPLVFAKKTKSVTMDENVYSSDVVSFTKGVTNTIQIAKKFIDKKDKILIIDDFLASGNALVALNKIIKESGATLVGAGIVIEKGFQKGGEKLRKEGFKIESLAIVEKMGKDGIVFKK
ncbi:xanthine phosphoribosyltransferase [Crassaminicella profunda]|uniref:xanthine phosphoribosyltransferase n=1 Tax=Crassaminicella profunda TaxID=1286698 RepID=UPI001CA6CC56|nr:xanthine phosphoribosyltransferase [Crassaminicella profunda]QZY54784.1 xanthine phosphoribosyltransferase [Crassaminicella profunda]